MSENVIHQKTTLIQQQLDAYNSDKPYIACIAGKRGGKTFVGSYWALKNITKNPTGVGLIAAPTVKLLQQAALETFFKLFPEYRKYYKKMDGVIELPSGGKVYTRSTDDPNALEGLTLDWIWLDEAGMMKRDVWRICRARISTTRGQLFITTTPYTLNWLYQDFFEPWREGTDDDIDVYRWPTLANPKFHAPEQERFIEKERERMRAEEFHREYEGEFTRMTGLVWESYGKTITEPSEAVKRIISYPDRVVAGFDYGFHNPAAIVVAVVKDATYYIVDEFKQSNMTNSELIEQCKTFRDKYGVQIFYPDPASPGIIEEMKREGLHCGAVDKDITLGLSHVDSLMREGKLFIMENCLELVKEIEQYHYPEGEDGKEFKEKPVKVNDHLCDALRYMCIGYRPIDPEVLMKKRLQKRSKIQRKNLFE